jgi:hypothetical protein
LKIGVPLRGLPHLNRAGETAMDFKIPKELQDYLDELDHSSRT